MCGKVRGFRPTASKIARGRSEGLGVTERWSVRLPSAVQEVHHVAVLHDVAFALGAELAGFAGAGFAA